MSHETTWKNVSVDWGSLTWMTRQILQQVFKSVQALTKVFMDNQLALEYVLVVKVGACSVISET